MSTRLFESGAPSAIEQLTARRRTRLPQRRFAIGGLIIIAAIAYLIASSFSSAVAAVVSPGQLIQRGAAVYGQPVRLQGRVVGSDSLDASTLTYTFRVSDGYASVLVAYASDLPGGFKTGAAVEAQGAYNGHVFTATSLTARCPTKYVASSQ